MLWRGMPEQASHRGRENLIIIRQVSNLGQVTDVSLIAGACGGLK